MMGFKMQPREAAASNDAGDHRMKMLLAVIEGPVETGSLKARKPAALPIHRNSIATPPALENETAVLQKDESVADPRRNLVTPTHDKRAQLLLPLARPPTLPSATIVRAQTQHMTGAPLDLNMRPSLLKMPSDRRGTYALNSVNYNHMPGTIKVAKKKTPQPSAVALALRRRINDTRRTEAPSYPSQLHSVWCWGNDHSDLASIIVDLLTRDPMAIRRKCQVVRSSSCLKRRCNGPFRRQRDRNEPYQFPLNLALHHQSQSNPNMKVLEILVATGPDVLRMADGRNGGGSLTIALRHHPQNLEIVHLLLKTNPKCIQVSDRRGNTPLHVACFQGASLEVIEELYQHDPTAIDQTNISGETPWQMVQRNSLLSSSPVAEYLYACSKRREGRIRKD